MSRRYKHLSLIILAQAGCVAVGLWMELQFVKASAYRTAERHAWSEMDAHADHLVSRLGSAKFESLEPGTPDYERARHTLTTMSRPGGDSMIVDRLWRVLVRSGETDSAPDSRLESEERIPWAPSRAERSAPAGSLWGTFALPDGDHLAAARALDGAAGYVVVHRPVADVVATSTGLVRLLPALSGMTFVWTCALMSIVVFLVLSRFYDEVDRERKQTANETLRGTQNLVRTRDAVIFGLAKLADSRDPETGDHLERISIYSTTLATALRRHPKYCEEVTLTFVKLIGISSALHDIGKVGIEDGILLKPGRLSAAERTRMERHSMIGGTCLHEIEQRLGRSNFLQMARQIALAHHERWDGTGYPNKLAGERIPIAARIVAVADVYDALSNKRVYKPAMPHEECVAIIRSQSGKHFDPDIVDVWFSIEARFRDIAARYSNAPPDRPDTSPVEESARKESERRNRILVSAVADGGDIGGQ